MKKLKDISWTVILGGMATTVLLGSLLFTNAENPEYTLINERFPLCSGLKEADISPEVITITFHIETSESFWGSEPRVTIGQGYTVKVSSYTQQVSDGVLKIGKCRR